MFQRFRERFGVAGLVVAIIALVLAVAGGAFAASGGLTGKQKKEVKKIATQYAGKNGAAGATGAAGPVGPVGPAGTAGAAGKEGSQGKQGDPGTPGTPGTPGASGKNVELGSPTVGECPAGGTTVQVAGEAATKKAVCNGKEGKTGFAPELPPGETETGIWAFGQTAEAPELFVQVPISFPVPLPEGEAPVAVEFLVAEEEFTTNCPGSATEPAAEPGFLCVFTTTGTSTLPIYKGALNPNEPFTTANEKLAGRNGAVLNFFDEEGFSQGVGTWAVTARP